MIDLTEEFAAAHAALRTDARTIAYLRDRLGIPDPTLGWPALVGAAPIVPSRDGTFAFASSGPRAVIVAEWAIDLDIEWLDAEVVDLVAFRPQAPHQWWLRAGDITTLGERAISLAGLSPDRPLRLVGTPLDWLRAGGGRHDDDAACVVDWSRFHPQVELGHIASVTCDSPALRDQLRKRHKETSRPTFGISVSRPARSVQARPVAAEARHAA